MPQFNARYQQKIDTEANWNKAVNFIPMKGEIIIYKDSDIVKEKIGDGVTTVGNLKFNTDDTLAYSGVAADSKAVGDALADIYAQMIIDYNNLLAFNTTEIIFDTNASTILGQAILGQFVLT